jgi:phosphatidylglycerol:prolipoprotein diacylglycerol transferase
MLGWRVIPRIGFGDFAISPHGVGIALGVFVGAWFMSRMARSRGYYENHVWNGATVGVIGAILGARIAYIVGHLDQFSSPAEWLQIWRGGISLIGGLLGAFALVLVYTKFDFIRTPPFLTPRAEPLSFFELVDLGAPGLGIGIAVGRIGDLSIGDHLGKETSFFLGWEYQGGELISAPPCITGSGESVYSTPTGCIEPGIVVHQTALYDMIWSLAIFGILMFLARRPRNRGFLFLSWASLYAVGRIGTDFLRVDKTWLGLGLTGSQLTSITVLLICLYFLVRHRGVPDLRRARPQEDWIEPTDGDLAELIQEEQALASEPSSLPPVSSGDPATALASIDEDRAGEPFNPAAPPPPPRPDDFESEDEEEGPDPEELLAMGQTPDESNSDD